MPMITAINLFGMATSRRVSSIKLYSSLSQAFTKSSLITIPPLFAVVQFKECISSWQTIKLSILSRPGIKESWLGRITSHSTPFKRSTSILETTFTVTLHKLIRRKLRIELGLSSFGISTRRTSMASKGILFPSRTPLVNLCSDRPVRSHVSLNKIPCVFE